jgi:hypothetical protein
MKAKVGIMRRALTIAGVSFDKFSNQQKPRVQAASTLKHKKRINQTRLHRLH